MCHLCLWQEERQSFHLLTVNNVTMRQVSHDFVSAGGLVFGTVFKDTDTHDVGSNVRVLQSSVLMFAHMQMMQQYIQMKKQGGNF